MALNVDHARRIQDLVRLSSLMKVMADQMAAELTGIEQPETAATATRCGLLLDILREHLEQNLGVTRQSG